jgi:beta-glucanase (GH16 family)
MKLIILSSTFLIQLIASAQLSLVWSDEFDGDNLDLSKWTFDLGGGGWGNGEPQYYTNNEANIGVDTGYLRITALEQVIDDANYTSARIKTQGLFDIKYAKVEARIKLPVGKGLWPAFWMLGSNITDIGWPKCGEIDIMEHVNYSLFTNGTFHYDNGGHVYFGDQTYCDVTEFHVYAIEWDASSIKWFLDGVEFFSADIEGGAGSREEFHAPFFMILNMAVGGYWPGYPDDSTPFPSNMFVDYVRVYSETASTNEQNLSLSELSLYPNPATSAIQLVGATTGDTYSISDLSGKIVAQGILQANHTIAISDLVNGMYLIEVSDAEGSLRRRLRFVKAA